MAIGVVLCMSTTRWRRLMPSGPIVEPDPAFSRRREVSWGNVVCREMTRSLLIVDRCSDRCGDRSRSAPDPYVDTTFGSSPGAAHGPDAVRVGHGGGMVVATHSSLLILLTVVVPVVPLPSLFRFVLVPICQSDICKEEQTGEHRQGCQASRHRCLHIDHLRPGRVQAGCRVAQKLRSIL